MKINDSFYFDLRIGKKNEDFVYKNFLSFEDLLAFKIREYTGSAGIMVECTCRVIDQKIRELFIQENQIIIYYGESETNSSWITLDITEVKPVEDSNNISGIVSFAAVFSIKFYRDRSSKAYKGDSLMVLRQVTKEELQPSSEALVASVAPAERTKKGKLMVWLRKYKTASEFMKDVWLHMDVGLKACPIIAITKNRQLIVKDIYAEIEKDPVCYFVQAPKEGSKRNEIRYLNKFNPVSHKFSSNLYLGYGTIVNIKDSDSGKESVKMIQTKPRIASTKVAETTKDAGFKFVTNEYQNSNVHKSYKASYFKNISQLIDLSSIVGVVKVAGLISDVNVTDVVYVDSGSDEYDGKYIVNTKVVTMGSNSPVMTQFYLCKDNKNHIENYEIGYNNKENSIWAKILDELNAVSEKTLQAVRNLRRIVVMARKVVNGRFMESVQGFLSGFKDGLLTCFSLFGTTIDLHSTQSLFNSLKLAGNSLYNQIVNAFIPYPFSYVLQNYYIEKRNWENVFSDLMVIFSPSNEYKALLLEVTGLIADLSNTASDISDACNTQIAVAEDNYIGGDMDLVENQDKVEKIATEFLDYTSNVDIPIPQIDLSESESLLPYEELKDLMADRTVAYLEQQGYLVDIDNFKNILLGIDLLDFNTIDKINNNTGNMLYARYWGTFSEIGDITDFMIKNSYKDIYLTVPTTKIINARDNSKVFMALPKSEENLTFYLNNKEVEMDVLEDIDLGFYTASGYSIPYNVYMSTEAFNSNSVVLEVRKNKS